MLQLEDVSVSFGGIHALSNVTFGVDDASIVGLVGPNGAGKTTLFDAISGLVRLTKGEIRFNGRSLTNLAPHHRVRAGVGRSFQVPRPLRELTVRENLMVAQHFGGGSDDEATIDKLLVFLELNNRQHAMAATDLSLTQRKMLEIGKALATRPKLLMLDEVFAGLETAGKRSFSDLILRLAQEWKLSVVMIEHDIETISRLCQRVIVLDFGRLIADGTPETVFEDPAVVRSYTGAGTEDA